MTVQNVKGRFQQTNLSNESDDYLTRREELRLAEIDLMRQRERVAGLRRKLPPGPAVEDYEFLEGPADLNAGDSPVRTVRLNELWTAPDRSLFIYHFMYGKKNSKPCPMCTLLIDGLNGVAHHIARNVDMAIVTAAEPAALRAHARSRGWDNLRLLSCGSNTFKYDLGSEDRDGNQDSEMSVFSRDHDGTMRHFYSAHPAMAADIRERGLDLICPVYNVLDLTPQGRGGWYASFDYPAKVHATHMRA